MLTATYVRLTHPRTLLVHLAYHHGSMTLCGRDTAGLIPDEGGVLCSKCEAVRDDNAR